MSTIEGHPIVQNGQIIMAVKERERLKVITLIRSGQITVVEGASKLGIGERQLYRSLARFQSEGDEGLLHRLRGATSNRRHRLKQRNEVVRLYKELYNDYGPTYFTEMLREHHQISICAETSRTWLLKAGVWKGTRKGREHRKRRERRAAIGELIQFDGSHHFWFEGRGPECCLLVAVDDASGTVMARFATGESTDSVLRFWRGYLHSKGIPKEIYTDYFSVYYHPKEGGMTDYGAVMAEMGVRCIYANSPQAKGRVERMNRTLQDRLLKELRRAQISTIEEANLFLDKEFLPKFNARFALTCSADGRELKNHHRPCVYRHEELEKLFSYRTTRQVYNDSTITLDAQWIQLLSTNAPIPLARTKVDVRWYLDGSLHIFWEGGEIGFKLLTKASRQKTMRSNGHPPAENHPWLHKLPIGRSKGNPQQLRKK